MRPRASHDPPIRGHTSKTAGPDRGTLVTLCVSYFYMTRDPEKGHGSDGPPPTGRVQERCPAFQYLPGTLLGCATPAPTGRIPIQSHWPEVTCKRALSTAVLRDARDASLRKLWESGMDGEAQRAAWSMGLQRVGHARADEPRSSSPSKPGPRAIAQSGHPGFPYHRVPRPGEPPCPSETSCFLSTWYLFGRFVSERRRRARSRALGKASARFVHRGCCALLATTSGGRG